MKFRLIRRLAAALLCGTLACGVPAEASVALHGSRAVLDGRGAILPDRAKEPQWSYMHVAAARKLPRLVAPLRARTLRPRPPAALPPRTRMPPSRLRRPPRQNSTDRISPSEALQLAMRRTPGSMGLGVELLPGPRPVYSVKLKAGNRIMRVLVDALTGRIIGR